MSEPPAPRPRPGGRSARVVHDVLEATIEVFAERGYAGLSIEEVAQRAGVNKTTVYRRWPTRAELLRAALRQMGEAKPNPDTGSLRDDLFILLHDRFERLSTPRGRGVARALMAERDEPELAELMAALRHERPSIPTALLTRAVARGELPADVDLALVTEALMALSALALWRGRPVAPAQLRALIDLLVTGATHGGGQRDAPPPGPAPDRAPSRPAPAPRPPPRPRRPA